MNKNAQNRRSRGRGGNKRHGNIRNQTFESNGPGVKVRGTAQQVLDKYLALARDASSSGDRIMAESYFQFAEHYFRLLNTEEQRNAERNGMQRRPGGERDRFSTPAGADASPDDLMSDEMDGDDGDGDGDEDDGGEYEAGLQRAIGAAPPRPRPSQDDAAGSEAPPHQPQQSAAPADDAQPQDGGSAARDDMADGSDQNAGQGSGGFASGEGPQRPRRRRRPPQQASDAPAPTPDVGSAAD